MARISRELILSTAIQLFNQNGYHATSMQDVAHEVGLKKPSLYHHFESKEAILLAALNNSMDHLIGELETVALSDRDAATKLTEAIRIHVLAIASYPESAAIFFREDRGVGAAYMEKYVAKRDQFEQLFRVILQDGIDKGIFRKTDPTISVSAIMGMINWMTRWYRAEGRLNANQIAGVFSDLILNGLRPLP